MLFWWESQSSPTGYGLLTSSSVFMAEVGEEFSSRSYSMCESMQEWKNSAVCSRDLQSSIHCAGGGGGWVGGVGCQWDDRKDGNWGGRLETDPSSMTAHQYTRESRFDPGGSGHHWRTWGREWSISFGLLKVTRLEVCGWVIDHLQKSI